MERVVLIDYGSGNLRSAEKALLRAADSLAGEVTTTSDPEVVARAHRIVLPGVGAFGACKQALDAQPGMVEALTTAVRDRGVPFLGICVGMQLLASRSLEFETIEGLGWIAGDVRPLVAANPSTRIPHMGWNTVSGSMPGALFGGLGDEPHMYFTHSFAFFPSDSEDVAAWCEHGESFPAAVRRDNLAGVQFHPEKSQAAGLQLLTNFLTWRP